MLKGILAVLAVSGGWHVFDGSSELHSPHL
jgi:hypothetical protein